YLRYFLRWAESIEPRHQRCLQARGYCRGWGRNRGSNPLGIVRVLCLQNCLGHFFDEQRDAVSALNDVLSDARWERLVADDAVDHGVDVALWQAIEGQSGYMRLSDPGRHKFRPEHNEQQNAKGRDSIYNTAEGFQTRRIGPMSVLEDHQNRI